MIPFFTPNTRHLAIAVCLSVGMIMAMSACSLTNPMTRQGTIEQKLTRPAQANPHTLLNAGINFYYTGDYSAAIKRLNAANEAGKNDIFIQLAALKYLAFSYCVSSQPTQCQMQFERALKLDRAFDLTPGENGHPLWGPAFERAKKAK